MAHRADPTVADCYANGPWLIWAICTIARSGSSWLSQLVESTQLLGNPDEYLLEWPRWCSRFGLSAAMPFEEYVNCLIRHRSTPNGVFAVKGSCDELQPFLRLFPSVPCVWLVRENKVEQAVSWHRAHHSGLWHHTDESQLRRPFVFSADQALAFYDEILRREALWRAYFSTCDAQPLILTYENLCRDPLAAVQAIAEHVGVDLRGIQRVASPLRITRDEQSAEWVQRTRQALLARDSAFGQRPEQSPHTRLFRANA